MHEIVTDAAVIARLPRAGWKVEWQWFWFRHAWLCLVGRMYPGRPDLRWSALWSHIKPLSTRVANAVVTYYGPLMVVRPMPWLLGPARQLHPEAFGDQP